jgi:hypothetical protein
MEEWECSLMAKASLDQERTRVLVAVDWTGVAGPVTPLLMG